MSKRIQLLASILCFALGSASLQATLSYWDGNGTNAGAGPAPSGIWGSDPVDDHFWSYDPLGESQTNAWTEGDTAVFSAGADATNAFDVTVDSVLGPSVGGLIFKDGRVTLSQGTITMTNEFECPIICYTNAIINSALAGLAGTSGFIKSGPGTLTLVGNSGCGGTNLVAEGIVAVAAGGSTITPLGLISAPTIVTNGATLLYATSTDCSEPVILYGYGVTNGGALKAISGSPKWNGGASLLANARINWDAGGTWTWQGNGASASGPGVAICTTNSGTHYDVTIGGNGVGTIRMNIAGRWATTGTGKIIKDGTCRLQLETPAYCTGGFYFNSGEIFPRGTPGFGNGPIYVAAASRTAFVTLNNVTLPPIGQNIVLAPGANLLFSLNKNTTTSAPLTCTCNGVISGEGGLSVTNFGKAILSAANTYTGNTTILGNETANAGAGILALTGSGKIAGSAVIDVQLNATLDVSAVTTVFTLGAAQTLKGAGTVIGNVTADGTLAPGGAIGNLTFNNNLALGANVKLAIEVDNSASPNSDLITVVGTLAHTGGGTLTVANIGAAALNIGDSFRVFSQLLPGGQAMAVTGGGAVWTNKLDVDGTIEVLALVPKVAATNLTILAAGANSFALGGMGGANLAYNVYASTNVTSPMTNWWLVGTTNANGSGVIQFLDRQATNPQQFYRFGQ